VTVDAIFGGLAVLSLGLVLWQFVCAMSFPLHQRIPNPTFAPDISILKPLKGTDTETRPCLESWMTQRYAGRVQILFGVHSPDDPVCVLVRELILAHPQIDAELVICPKMLGANAKVSTLIQLQRVAKYDALAISDADVRVPDDFLMEAAAPLESNAVGLVNCFYKLANPQNFGMRCEAFMVNGDFWSQVLQAQSLKPIDFALGAVMLTTQSRLREIGAFDSLVEYLADDYQLGNRIAKGGGEIVISPVVVQCWSAPMTARQVWEHQLRWARTVRVCQPAAYFFSILNDVTLWALVWLAANPGAWVYAASCMAIRGTTAILIERKMTGRFDLFALTAVFWTDLARPVIWGLSFLGNTVVWRGEKYRVLRGGKLMRLV
jgi:ceramide glucosyltransferase